MTEDAEVVVWYTVPVGAHVDMHTGTVTRVVVVDEEIKLDNDTNVRDTEFKDTVPPIVKAQAVKIAEAAIWPGWENGY